MVLKDIDIVFFISDFEKKISSNKLLFSNNRAIRFIHRRVYRHSFRGLGLSKHLTAQWASVAIYFGTTKHFETNISDDSNESKQIGHSILYVPREKFDSNHLVHDRIQIIFDLFTGSFVDFFSVVLSTSSRASGMSFPVINVDPTTMIKYARHRLMWKIGNPFRVGW